MQYKKEDSEKGKNYKKIKKTIRITEELNTKAEADAKRMGKSFNAYLCDVLGGKRLENFKNKASIASKLCWYRRLVNELPNDNMKKILQDWGDGMWLLLK